MTSGIQTDFWTVVGKSVCGASHRRRGAVNQDAIGWWDSANSGLAVAVADGHGSASSYRSAAGAALAVQSAGKVLAEFSERCVEYDAAAAAAAGIPSQVAALWRQLVEEDIAAAPFTTTELALLDDSPEAQWRPYGSTVLAALATPSHVLYLQLGDGDILIVSDSGAIARPWPRDPRLLGIETTSLCGSDAAEEMRVTVEPHKVAAPALVVMATDGYANSFREDHGFLRTGEDLLQTIREEGIESVARSLEDWLNEASTLGSGDDITVAVLCRAGVGASDGC
jgi:serine/threonine protein phosphatase PrpC